MTTPITLECTQGRTQTFSRATPNADGTYGGIFSGSETITATVWPADSEAYVLQVSGSPVCIWTAATLSQWAVILTDASTAMLTPGIYTFEITSTTSAGGETARLFRGFLEVTSAAGSSTPSPADLVSANYAFKLLSEITLTVGQQEAVPDLISMASAAIRSWCHRVFTQQAYVETCDVELDGEIRLSEIPVNTISRIQNIPANALWIMNQNAVEAWVGFATTGDSTGPTGITVTGLLLNSVNSGTLTTTTITFTANQTIAQLSAIVGTHSGWTSYADSVLGLYPVTELIPQDGLIGKGATPNDQPDDGAILRVYSSNITNAQPNPQNGMRTGLIWVGRQYQGPGPSWGQGWEELEGPGPVEPGSVKVTYNGGFAIIPREIQLATIELVKAALERLQTDLLLKSEGADGFRYVINEGMVDMLPKNIIQGLSRYRITDA